LNVRECYHLLDGRRPGGIHTVSPTQAYAERGEPREVCVVDVTIATCRIVLLS